MALLLSIIIPVYNVEKTLESSLSSIKCDRPEEVELVFVNDGSSDKTLFLLESFKEHTMFPCQIVNQENAGVAAARNVGLGIAGGEYLVFLDADDWWEDGALDRLLALTGVGADIIGWDFMSVGKDGERTIRQAAYSTPSDALKNLMGGTMKWNLWLFAVKRDFVNRNQLRFLPGENIGEDMQFMLKAFSRAANVVQIHEPLYRYNAYNPQSISARFTVNKIGEITRNLEEADSFLSKSEYAALSKEYLPYLKLYLKLPLLVSLRREDYEFWYKWFPESNAFATLNHALPFRVRLLQGLASRKLWLCVKLYNVIVYRLIYPLLFRFRKS